jgi:hypothetical protein
MKIRSVSVAALIGAGFAVAGCEEKKPAPPVTRPAPTSPTGMTPPPAPTAPTTPTGPTGH